MFNVVSCGMMSDAWTILDNLGKIRHDRCNDAMTHADRETFHRVQVSPFLITSPDFWRCSVALCFSMLQQYLCAVTPPSTSPSIQNSQQYSILGIDAYRLSMQFQVGALPRPADLERQRERLMAEAPMDVSKAFTVQCSLEGEGEHKIS